MKLTRLKRIVELLDLLQAANKPTVNSLSTACEVSRRTVFRDLDLLRQAGVAVFFDDEKQTYSVQGGFQLPPSKLTDEEADALTVLGQELGYNGRGLPFFSAAYSAAVKLAANLPAKLQQRLKKNVQAVHIDMPPRNRLVGYERTYRELLAAIAARRKVRIQYGSLTEWDTINTLVSPYRVLFSRRSWYVIGRSSMHRAVRTFNLGRIRQIETTDNRYSVPRGFTIERYLRNAWGIIPEPGPDREVVVRFAKQVAQNVAEISWHKTQRLEFLPDGSLEYRATVSGLGEISWWIMGYGDQAEVVEPAELRAMLVARCRAMLKRYAGE